MNDYLTDEEQKAAENFISTLKKSDLNSDSLFKQLNSRESCLRVLLSLTDSNLIECYVIFCSANGEELERYESISDVPNYVFDKKW